MAFGPEPLIKQTRTNACWNFLNSSYPAYYLPPNMNTISSSKHVLQFFLYFQSKVTEYISAIYRFLVFFVLLFLFSSYVTANGLVPAAYLGPAMHRPNGPPIKTASITANTASCHLSRDRNISSVPTSNLSTVCHTTIPLLKKMWFYSWILRYKTAFCEEKNVKF